jgi:hypothetical protein
MSVVISRRTFAAALALSAAPIGARAQAPGKTYRIAVWHQSIRAVDMAEGGWPPYSAFFSELRRLGFVEGRNLIVHRFTTESRTERYDATAREIVALRPDVIIPSGGVPAQVLKPLTSTIPIVVCAFADPIALGFVTSLARPGGNITGFNSRWRGGNPGTAIANHRRSGAGRKTSRLFDDRFASHGTVGASGPGRCDEAGRHIGRSQNGYHLR